MGTFNNLEEAKELTLLTMYENLSTLEFGSEEYLSAAQSIAQLEKGFTEQYKADSDYAGKVKAAEIDADLKKELAEIDAETKAKIAEKELDLKTDISNKEYQTKIEAAKIEAKVKQSIADKEMKVKKEMSAAEVEMNEKNQQKEVVLKTIETGAKVLIVSAQLIVFMEELSKSRKFEETGVEVCSAFKKVWGTFKPLNM